MLTLQKQDKIKGMNEISELAKWLQEQLDIRYWTATDLAERANTHTSTITRILTGKRKPGPEILNSIAVALGESPEKVFRLAKFLPDEMSEVEELNGLSAYEEELLGWVRKLDQTRQWAVLEIVKGLVTRRAAENR